MKEKHSEMMVVKEQSFGGKILEREIEPLKRRLGVEILEVIKRTYNDSKLFNLQFSHTQSCSKWSGPGCTKLPMSFSDPES
jgi:hypothetical protein